MPTVRHKPAPLVASREITLNAFPAEWEAMKARCRPLPHSAAVRECAYLSEEYRHRWRAKAKVMVKLDDVLQALRNKKIPFVLTGAYGISGWTGRPRSTHDIDILVRSGRNHARAVNALKERYPGLEVRRFPGLTAFFVPGETESVIDVSFPNRKDNAATLETAIWVEERGQKYRIPALEAALANKYGAMLSLGRDEAKRTMDAVDFHTMVKHSMDEGRQPIDLDRLAELGELVWPGGGGAEILLLVDQAKAGHVPTVSTSPKKSNGSKKNGGA
jgi:Aminoglycoside-2''-adenylyltransferase